MATPAKIPASKMKKSEKKDIPMVIRKDMRVRDIQAILPSAEACMAQYGLHCTNCSIGGEEILEDGCRMHGMSDEDMNDLVTDLNILLAERPAKPQTLTLTEAAARSLIDVMENEGKAGWGLSVGTDPHGGFSMEFRERPSDGDKVFAHDTVPDVRLFASAVTLAGIGGATIDFREGRFKLDLDTDNHACGCGGNCTCSNGECGCGKH